MRFKHSGAYHSKQVITPAILDKINFSDRNNIYYTLDANFQLLGPAGGGKTGLQLQVKWQYLLYHLQTMIFDFSTEERYEVLDSNEPVEENDLKDILNKTFNSLQKSFEGRRKEFTSFPPMQHISLDLTESLLPRLRQATVQPAKRVSAGG